MISSDQIISAGKTNKSNGGLNSVGKLAPEHTLSLLAYDPRALRSDISSNIRSATTLLLDDQERSLYIIRSQSTATWLGNERSAILVVNGGSPRLQRHTSTSFVCARLLASLNHIRHDQAERVRKHILGIHFLCGEHSDSDDIGDSPVGVIRSLLAQLMSHCKDIDMEDELQLCRPASEDLRTLCKCFEEIMSLLPAETTIFIIIDNLSLYVDDRYMNKDAERLVRWFICLLRSQQERQGRSRRVLTLKLALTAPVRFHGIESDWLGAGEELNVPERMPKTGGFTEAKWEYNVESQLRSQ